MDKECLNESKRCKIEDKECLNESKRCKIEETVLQILEASDLETTTECSVREAAAERLGFGLSDLTQRRLVRQLVDSFLFSTANAILGTTSRHRHNAVSNNIENAEIREKQRRQQNGAVIASEGNYDGKVICKLSNKRRVTVRHVNGTPLVSIRDFYIQDGNLLPHKGTNSGVCLTATQWSSFKNSFPSIQEAIENLESQLRPKHACHPSNNLNNKSEAVLSEEEKINSVADSAVDKRQTEAGNYNSRCVVKPPIKRKQAESEAELTNSVVDSAAEKNQTQSGISNLMGNFHPHIKSKQNGTDISTLVTMPDFQNQVLAERIQERAGTSASVATSSSGDHILADRNQIEAITLDAFSPEQLTSDERKRTDADISSSMPAFPTQGQSHSSVNAPHPGKMIPIQTSRLDGRNYHSWRHQMELFLNQVNIAYVLAEPCPSITLNPEASFEEKVMVQSALRRWTNDDYLCRHNILNSLCDNLFQLYSQKSYSARELWEELTLSYEDFGTKRSEINKYIHFQMVDGVSVLEQVQELHKIANSIRAYGTRIDETFHASVIVSKLPPSWKELRVRLMHEEFLPINMLMHRIQVEEESRNCYKRETTCRQGHMTEPLRDNRLGMRKKESKRVCHRCGKEGHIIKYCPDKKFDTCEKSNEKENGSKKIVDAANTT